HSARGVLTLGLEVASGGAGHSREQLIPVLVYVEGRASILLLQEWLQAALPLRDSQGELRFCSIVLGAPHVLRLRVQSPVKEGTKGGREGIGEGTLTTCSRHSSSYDLDRHIVAMSRVTASKLAS